MMEAPSGTWTDMMPLEIAIRVGAHEAATTLLEACPQVIQTVKMRMSKYVYIMVDLHWRWLVCVNQAGHVMITM